MSQQIGLIRLQPAREHKNFLAAVRRFKSVVIRAERLQTTSDLATFLLEPESRRIYSLTEASMTVETTQRIYRTSASVPTCWVNVRVAGGQCSKV